MTDLDVLLAELRACPPETIVDRVAEALAEAGEAVVALADRDGHDTATLWWAAGALSTAYSAVVPHTGIDLPEPPSSPGPLADDPGRLIDFLGMVTDALVRAARAAVEPDLIHALASAGDLAEQARDAVANARAAV
jgi:hypothetical protein